MLDAEKSVRRGIMTITTSTSFIIALARVSALAIAIWAVQSHAINAGAVYLLITYTFNLLLEINNISTILRNLYQISGDTEEMLAILAEPVDIADSSTQKLSVTNGMVSINNITFSHGTEAPLFKNLSLTIPGGQKVGIVGVSGSGKTTLTKLLLRLNDPREGSITIDGQNISQLFHRSLKENIAYAKPAASNAAIIAATKSAQAYEFIEELEDGFATLVGERGVKLSGGQRQRVAIARAILKDAPVLILDEATSALDSESEVLIQRALDKLMKGRTSIVIAHRLSTIAKLDRIIVMDKGAVVEDGTHQELLAQKGIYAKLWAHQSGGFIEE